MRKNLLFVCSRNKWRSRTAETMYAAHPEFHARSAGTSKEAAVKVNSQLIQWADIIFVMEKKHRNLLTSKFPVIKAPVVVLDIADDYKFMDEELISMIRSSVESYFSVQKKSACL